MKPTEEFLNKFRQIGASVEEDKGWANITDFVFKFHGIYDNYTLGAVYIDSDGDIYDFDVACHVETTVNYKFTKKKVEPKVKIKTKFFKSYEPDTQLELALNTMKQVILWLKTAEAKRKKIELDTDFES